MLPYVEGHVLFHKKDLPRWEVLSNTKENNCAMLYIKHKGRRNLFKVPHKDLNERWVVPSPKVMNF